MKRADGIWIKDFPLKRISSFKIGGKAGFFFLPDTIPALRDFLCSRSRRKYYLVGNATNILFPDKTYAGTVISLKACANVLMQAGQTVTAGAGMDLETLTQHCIQSGLAGLEKLSGIPGTVGGALAMNAGAFGSEISDSVVSVTVMDSKGRLRKLKRSQIKFAYRSAHPLDRYIILEAVLKLKKGDQQRLLRIRKDILKQRAKKQPLDCASCGSIFKRPAGHYAGTLIEQCGLKNHSVGGAKISQKHANFIINTGRATSHDVRKLIRTAQDRVFRHAGIRLEPEIKILDN